MSSVEVSEAINLREEYERAKELVQKAKMFKPGTTPWEETNRAVRMLVKPGIYIHHKSSKVKPMRYIVFGVSDDTEEPGDYGVMYFAKYLPFVGDLARRPLIGSINGKRKRGFLEPVGPDGAKPKDLKPRFVFERSASYLFAALESEGFKTFK
jgi:hypothetical protein